MAREGLTGKVDNWTGRVWVVLAPVALIALLSIGAPAQAVPLPQPPTVDLLTDADVRIDGADIVHNAGYSVADAGDVNGDGVDDVIVGADWASTPGRDHSGLVYVVFGGPSLASFNLSDLGSGGFRVIGATREQFVGKAVAGAGDVNGDGLDDVIVGVSDVDNSGHTNSGSSYVVYGKSDNTDEVDLANFQGGENPEGFRIDGATPYVYSGTSVSGAGDVNGDGFDDVIIGAPLAHHNRNDGPGSAYVVYGGRNMPPTVDLADIDGGDNTPGFRLAGVNNADRTGISASGVGDMNSDGYSDVIVGAKGAGNNNREDSGSSYIVFGDGRSPAAVDLSALGNRGFRIDGAAPINCPQPPWCAGDQAGSAVSGAGDVNGDDTPDVIVGAAEADNNGRDGSGSSFVVFGKSDNFDTVDLADFGAAGNTAGFRIDGAENPTDCYDPYCYGGVSGASVSGVGDVNGDGLSDMIVGAPMMGNNDRAFSGSAYVVYGKSGNVETVDLEGIEAPGNPEGFRIDGAAGCDSLPTCAGDFAGASVSGAGDVNGDECPDMIVGAPYADNNDLFNSGSAYIVYGRGCAIDVVDPDCDGTPYNNTHAVNGFNASTEPPYSNELADLLFKYTVCGTAGTNNSLNDHVDIKQPPNSTIENTFDMQPRPGEEGRYAGRLKGRIAHGPGSNRQYSTTEAKLTVEYADLRFLERERWARDAASNWGKTNPIVDNCNRQADPGVSNVQGDNNLLGPDYLAGENIGTFDYQPWVPVDPLGRPTTSLASFIASCFKLTSTSGPFSWYAWVWQTFSVVDGHRHLTVGPIHTDTTPPSPTNDNPSTTFEDDPAGFTSTLGGTGFELRVCDNAGAVGVIGCGGPSDPVLHRNGDGQGCYEIVATNKGADKTQAQSNCVTWAPRPPAPRGKECKDDGSISKRCLSKREGIKRRS